MTMDLRDAGFERAPLSWGYETRGQECGLSEGRRAARVPADALVHFVNKLVKVHRAQVQGRHTEVARVKVGLVINLTNGQLLLAQAQLPEEQRGHEKVAKRRHADL